MAVTVTPYNALTTLIVSAAFGVLPQIDKANLRFKLLNNTATFTNTHTSIEQVDNGSKAAVTMTIAAPGVITDNAHGFSAGQPLALLTTGALPTGFTAGVFYYVVSPTTNNYQLSATPGGAAITTTGSQSGTHTRYASGSYEMYGNGWIPGGPSLASVSVTATAISDATVNDTVLSATNPSVTAVGGSLPPAAAYKAVLYDASTMKPMLFVDFGQAQQAGVTTDFKFLIATLGLLNLVA